MAPRPLWRRSGSALKIYVPVCLLWSWMILLYAYTIPFKILQGAATVAPAPRASSKFARIAARPHRCMTTAYRLHSEACLACHATLCNVAQRTAARSFGVDGSWVGACRYGNEMDVQATLSMLVEHVRASKQAQALALEHLPKNIQLPGVELKHMLDLCLYFIPAHRLKASLPNLCAGFDVIHEQPR